MYVQLFTGGILQDRRMEIGYIVAGYFTGWQIVFGIHINEEHLYIHFVMNTVSYENGLKFSYGIREFQDIRQHIGKLISEYHNRKKLFVRCMTIEEMMKGNPSQLPCTDR